MERVKMNDVKTTWKTFPSQNPLTTSLGSQFRRGTGWERHHTTGALETSEVRILHRWEGKAHRKKLAQGCTGCVVAGLRSNPKLSDSWMNS